MSRARIKSHDIFNNQEIFYIYIDIKQRKTTEQVS